jgi:hypothetical protein
MSHLEKKMIRILMGKCRKSGDKTPLLLLSSNETTIKSSYLIFVGW